MQEYSPVYANVAALNKLENREQRNIFLPKYITTFRSMNYPKVCLLQETEVHNLSLLSPCVAGGRTEECVMTNQSAWRVCITSKSHTLISSRLYQLNVHSVKS